MQLPGVPDNADERSFKKLKTFIFFCGLFFEGVYNRRQVKTVGELCSILFNYIKGGLVMKRILLLLIVVVFLAGCSAEWYEHDTIYKNHDHMFYSWGGYKNTTQDDLQKSEAQDWWGAEIPYIPAE